MHDYEICILNQTQRPSALVKMLEADDNSAIQSALRLARGRPVEVWRDSDCIYRNSGASG